MIRVLHVLGEMGQGGAENFLMNLYRNIDRNKIQFDFLVNRKGVFDDEIRKLGGRIFYIPALQKVGMIKYIRNLDKFLTEHKEYMIIHSHLNQVTGLILERAKKANIPIRIAHSHNSQSSRNLIVRIYKYFLGKKINKNANYYCACSDLAAKWLFPNNPDVIMVKNGIELEKFKFNELKRKKIRKELNIDDNCIVIGHVGRFDDQKNHLYLLDIFKQIVNQNQHDNIKLVLAGDGKLKRKIEEKIDNYNLREKVILLGNRKDIDYIYQGFDIFIFPSKFEGLPLTLVEAQTSGLPLYISKNISKEVDITGNVTFLDIEDSPQTWADAIVKNLYEKRKNVEEQIKSCEYNVNMVQKQITELYENALKQIGEKNNG